MKFMASVVLLSGALISFSFAQQAPEPFVPFVVDEAEYKAIQNFLSEQPMKFALPLARWFEQMETKAQAKAKEEKK